MSNYSVFINGKENENWDEVIKIEIINKSGYCWTIPIEEIQTLTIRNKIISEYTEPEKLKLERVTVFQEGGAIYAKHLNAEFNNIIDYINSKFNVGEGLND